MNFIDLKSNNIHEQSFSNYSSKYIQGFLIFCDIILLVSCQTDISINPEIDISKYFGIF